MNTKNCFNLPAVVLGLLCFSRICWVSADEFTEPEPLVDVHIETVKRAELHRGLTFYGTVVPERASDSHHAASAIIAATISGQIIDVPAIEGDRVRVNDVLVKLNSRQADAVVQTARASLKQSKAAFARQQKLAKLEGTSRKKLEQAQQQQTQAEASVKEAQTLRALLDIRTPISGIVLKVNVRPGETVLAGTPVVEIEDIDRLTAEIQIPASQLAAVQTGQEAAVQSTGKDTWGKVNYIGKRINPATGTATARITLPADSGLYSGQFVRARVIIEKHTGLVVPINAVRHQPDGSGVVAVVSRDRVNLQTVTLGIEDSDQVEIAGEGIREGTQVVTLEAYGLPDNTHVRIIKH